MKLAAYYFRAHMYTIVPDQVRADMEWMAARGTKIVCLGVLEQDLYAARENIAIIAREAERAGMLLWAVPSRWGGLVAGCPKVPSFFASTHPETWIQDSNGTPHYNGVHGPMTSVHHPETLAFFQDAIQQTLALPFHGLIWDEPKGLQIRDCSSMAREALGGDPAALPVERHVDAMCDFFDALGQYARTVKPEVGLGMFLYANLAGYEVERCARIGGLDYFGCDGRPWADADGGVKEGEGKVLLGPGERFLAAARGNGKGGLFLIENHAMADADCALMAKRMPEILALAPELLIYYYYPRSLENPNRNMQTLADALAEGDFV